MPLTQNTKDSVEWSTVKGNVHVMVDEETPLLRKLSSPHEEEVLENTTRTINTRRVVLIHLLLITLLQAGDQLTAAPLVRVFESIYCYRYYEVHDPSLLLQSRATVGPGAIGGVREELCRIAEVQAQVAALEGNLALFNGLPSLILALPFGILADRWGRRPIIILGLISFPLTAAWVNVVCWFWQVFDIYLVLLSSLLGLLGGGTIVLAALFNTVFADVATEESRASIFFLATSCGLATSFLGPMIGALLMNVTPWLPILVGQSLMTIPITLILLVPETMHHNRVYRLGTADNNESVHKGTSSHNGTSTWLSACKDIGSMLRQDWRVPALALTFVLHLVPQSSVKLLMLQYVSTRYSVSLSRATFLVSLQSGLMIGVYLVILPWISHRLMSRHGYSGRRKDLELGRYSVVILVLGWIGISVAPRLPWFISSLFLMTLGLGFHTLVRSLITSIISPHNVAKLYTIIGALDTIGMMGLPPFFAWLFKVGLNGDGGLVGLPFLCLGILYAILGGVVFLVRTERQAPKNNEDEEVRATE